MANQTHKEKADALRARMKTTNETASKAAKPVDAKKTKEDK